MPQKNAMTSIAQGSFDTSALNKELAMALEEDRKYKLTDSMKKRAIRTAANYDEFKNLVACADLTPVSQKDLNNIAKSDRKHNISYKKKESRKEFGANLHFDKAPSSIQEPPSTSVVFCRNWRRHLKSNQEKYR
jgi:hypothetical protein